MDTLTDEQEDLEREQFSDRLIEELRILSVQARKLKEDPKSIILRKDEDEGEDKEYSLYPSESKDCIAAVVKALRKNPKRAALIMFIVGEFIGKSTGAGFQKFQTLARLSEDIHTLDQEADFYRKVVIAMAESLDGEAVTPPQEVEQIQGGAATGVEDSLKN